MFGSTGYKIRLSGNVLENYKFCAMDKFKRNMMTKTYVWSERVIGFRDPHLSLGAFCYHTVNIDGKNVVSPHSHLPKDRSLCIYHYFLKCYENLEKKANKGFADRIDRYQMDIFENYDRNECYNNKAQHVMKKYMKED